MYPQRAVLPALARSMNGGPVYLLWVPFSIECMHICSRLHWTTSYTVGSLIDHLGCRRCTRSCCEQNVLHPRAVHTTLHVISTPKQTKLHLYAHRRSSAVIRIQQHFRADNVYSCKVTPNKLSHGRSLHVHPTNDNQHLLHRVRLRLLYKCSDVDVLWTLIKQNCSVYRVGLWELCTLQKLVTKSVRGDNDWSEFNL